MNTVQAMMNALAAQGKKMRVFDWHKAARILKDRMPDEAAAGLQDDLEYTCGIIWEDGKPVLDDYTFLRSNWAIPVLCIGDREIPCWVWDDEENNPEGWDPYTKWPESALRMLEETI